MAKYNGVEFYDIGRALIKISFANGNRTCMNCEFCRSDRGIERCICELQHGKIIPVDVVSTGRDMQCPIEFEEEENE